MLHGLAIMDSAV